jgi:hypothetical protein
MTVQVERRGDARVPHDLLQHLRRVSGAAQRSMSQRTGSTVVEVTASHSVYVSQPAAVADLIKQAVSAGAAQQ